MIKEKVYKEKKIEKSVILPGDPFGLPDDFFLLNNFYTGGYNG